MYTLTVTRGSAARRYVSRDLPALIQQAGEYDTSMIVDIDGRLVYSVAFTSLPNTLEALAK